MRSTIGKAAALVQFALALALAAAPGTADAKSKAKSEAQAYADRKCLTEGLYFEAGSEGKDGMTAVAEVIFRRAKTPGYPKTICAVVYNGAPSYGCQFSFACDGKKRSAHRDPAAWNEAVYIAGDELTGPGRLVDTSKGATHFHTLKVRPSWSRRFVRTVQIGNHIFYRQPGRGYEARDLRNAAAS